MRKGTMRRFLVFGFATLLWTTVWGSAPSRVLGEREQEAVAHLKSAYNAGLPKSANLLGVVGCQRIYISGFGLVKVELAKAKAAACPALAGFEVRGLGDVLEVLTEDRAYARLHVRLAAVRPLKHAAGKSELDEWHLQLLGRAIAALIESAKASLAKDDPDGRNAIAKIEDLRTVLSEAIRSLKTFRKEGNDKRKKWEENCLDNFGEAGSLAQEVDWLLQHISTQVEAAAERFVSAFERYQRLLTRRTGVGGDVWPWPVRILSKLNYSDWAALFVSGKGALPKDAVAVAVGAASSPGLSVPQDGLFFAQANPLYTLDQLSHTEPLMVADCAEARPGDALSCVYTYKDMCKSCRQIIKGWAQVQSIEPLVVLSCVPCSGQETQEPSRVDYLWKGANLTLDTAVAPRYEVGIPHVYQIRCAAPAGTLEMAPDRLSVHASACSPG